MEYQLEKVTLDKKRFYIIYYNLHYMMEINI